jgi:hypothetical protein
VTQELSDKEIAKLFNEVSTSLRGNDTVKLDELMASETIEVEEEATPEDESLPDQPEETPEEKEEEDNSGPQDKTADDTVDDNEDPPEPKESDEVVKLREQLAKLEKDNHSLRSQAGRVPHVQRRLQELDKKLDELTKKSPSSQPNDLIANALKGIKETDPELAESIAKAIADATNAVAADSHNTAKETLNTLREIEAASHTDNEMDKLLGMYPNARDIFTSQHWKDWKKSQNRTWQTLASSDLAEDVAEAFERYSADMLKKFPELAANVSKEEPVKEPVKTKNEEAEKIEEERARKKQTTAKVGSPAAPAKVSVPDDPDALFKKFSEQIRKERTG